MLDALLGAAGSSDQESPGGFQPSDLDLLLRQGKAGGGIVVLHGSVSPEGMPSLTPFLQEVDRLDSAVGWRIIFRHGDGPAPSQGVDADLLTGYGFELAIKSSEYKTHAEEKKDGEEGRAQDSAHEGADADGAEEDLKQEERRLDGELELDGLLFHVLLEKNPALRSRLWDFKEQLEVERDTDKQLKAWEIEDIGLQATAKIKSAPNPLLALMKLSQNFPAHVVSLAKTPVPDKLRRGQQKMMTLLRREGMEIFAVNGRVVRPDHSDLSLFPMMKTLQPFFVGVERLVRLGVSEKVACELLKESQPGKSPERLDWRSPYLPPPVYNVMKDKQANRWPTDLQSLLYGFGGLSPLKLPLYTVVYVFDPAEVADLIQAYQLIGRLPMPMQIHFVMVPSSSRTVDWDEEVLGQRPSWLEDKSRAGESTSRASRAMAAGFGKLLAKPSKARGMIKALAQIASGFPEGTRRWPETDSGMDQIKSVLLKASPDEFKEESAWEDLFKKEKAHEFPLANATNYATMLGVPLPSVLVNGRLLLKGAYEGQQGIFPIIGHEQQVFMQGVYTQQITKGSQLTDFIASQGLLAAYHEEITPDLAQRGGEEGRAANVPQVVYLQLPVEPMMSLPTLESLEREELMESDEQAQQETRQQQLDFLHVTVIKSLSQAYLLHTLASHLLAPDRSVLRAKLKSGLSAVSRWAALVDTSAGTGAGLEELAICVRSALKLESTGDEETARSLNRQRLLLLKFMGAAVPAALAADPDLPAERIRSLCELGIQKKIDPDYQQQVKALISSAGKKALPGEDTLLMSIASSAGGSPSAALWICNGRRVEVQAGGQPMSWRHVQLLELIEAQYDLSDGAESEVDQEEEGPASAKEEPPEGPKTLHKWLSSEAKLPERAYGLAASIRSEALSSGAGDRMSKRTVAQFDRLPASFRLVLPPVEPEAACPIKVFGVLDPLSTTAQSASAVLALFGMAFNAEVNLIFNPASRHSEYPLKRYYREVIRWPEHLADGRRVAELEGGGSEIWGQGADFSLATTHVLTAAVHALPTWLVTAYEAGHDMDNLRSVDVGDGQVCEAVYVLRQLYVEGQAYVMDEDGYPASPAKGVQLNVLEKGTQEEDTAVDDTIVMGNLGYFQVHGNPGIYDVTVKPGQSSDVFEAVNVKDLEVSSWITPPYQMRVKVREGHSHEELFDLGRGPPPKPVSLMGLFGGALKSLMGGEDSKAAAKPKRDNPKAVAQSNGSLPTIHIFSVASGHLYEKLLGIMILSVRNRTQCPLHFWFIDNFLSPRFKAFIPLMAKRYNFGFDFVTYKWPSWLNPQSEKQRLIWAYKVLFLDVLFPMDVPKVIFIDADQVVRADVRELWDLDLEGKVYAWVPMGETNPDTEGFRFWKQGYWANHLGSLPYHIAALYVVDLIEFRRTSVGDKLRGTYNQLSRDPNSLSNLEQDLVNFAQHDVPIYSLPAEWLWCETWCSQETKPKAKTIDLCQNPLTKEPKIVMAKRIIAEWQGYHDEVQRFHDEIQDVVLPAAFKPALDDGKAEL